MTLENNIFENILGKGGNASNKHYLLLSTTFSVILHIRHGPSKLSSANAFHFHYSKILSISQILKFCPFGIWLSPMPTYFTSILSLQDPLLGDINPKRGPMSGGTRVTIHGQHLDAGTEVIVRIGSHECAIIE